MGAWSVIVIGGYVTSTNAGLSCQNVVDCGEASAGALIEITHRVAAWVEGLLVLALLIVVVRTYRGWLPVRNMTLLSFALVTGQALVGMLSVYSGVQGSGWYPILVTLHLGVATLFLAVSVLNASAILRRTPPLPKVLRSPIHESSPGEG